MVLKKLLKLLSINLGEGYKAIYKQSEVHYSTERTIIHKRGSRPLPIFPGVEVAAN